MSHNVEKRIPSPQELENDLREYLSKKYGENVQIQIPGLTPEPEPDPIEQEPTVEVEPSLLDRIEFDLNPEELEQYLDRYVVRQREAKEVLATKICTHYKRIRRLLERGERQDDVVGNIKNNIILIGPTGVGKTFLIKLIANKLGVPFVKGDATKFSETGYVGGDVEDLIRDLVHEADGNIDLAQYGIIFIDEIDKIASTQNLVGADVSRTGVQRALLKPMEETDVELRVPHDLVAQMQAVAEFQRTGKSDKQVLNTRNILFIVSGAFQGLEEIVARRIDEKSLGFKLEHDRPSQSRREDLLTKVKAEDLINYGFESEFIGRLPVIATLHELTEDDLLEILKNPNSSVVRSKKLDFEAYNIDIRFEVEALRLLARNAASERTGARGLVRSMENALIKFEKKLPSTDITCFLVTPELVRDPSSELAGLLENPDSAERVARFRAELECEKRTMFERLQQRQPEFVARFGRELSERRVGIIVERAVNRSISHDAVIEEIRSVHRNLQEFETEFNESFDTNLKLTSEAIDRMTELVFETGDPPHRLGHDRFRNYQHGYKLLQERKGLQELEIPERAVDDPEGYMNELIQEMYQS